MARALCVAGFSVYRADVLGVGDSDGHFEEITFVSELRDVRSVFEHVVEDGAPRRLVAVGHSMGANLALRIAIEFPQISKVVLIAPDLVKRGQVDQLFTEQQLTELRRVGWTMRKGLHINNTFVEELRAVPALTIAGELRRPVVVIQGSEDELYEQTGAEALAQRALCGRFVEIGGAEHNFLYPDARRALFECVINECHIPPD
jgi:alpha-beta hydrolase superfamily lysophospholipase